MEDIKILLNNHAHYDHAGGLALLKKRTGAKLYANRKQAEQLKRGGKQDFAFGDEIAFTPVKPDRRIRDKDEIRLGDVKLVVNYTPGHTKGSTTFKTTAKNGDSFYQVVFLSSLSVLDYDLVSNPNYRDIANDFRATFGFLRSLKVDIFLGSHASFFKMKEKAEALKSAPGINPFVDPEGYRSFILRNEKTFLEKLAKQQAGPAKAKQ
ncbi:MAG: MBL fold metallo-hydrolase [Acidobacteriota bacterium]|nr:MBL fold metallo-hydrolase [Acidobacteriota bacterium]